MKVNYKLIDEALAAYKKEMEADARRLLSLYSDGKFLYEKESFGKHYGPGPHPGTGTSQDVHGSPGAVSGNQLSLFVTGTQYGDITVHPDSSVKFDPDSEAAWKNVFDKEMPVDLKDQLLAAYGIDDPKIETEITVKAGYVYVLTINVSYFDRTVLTSYGPPKQIGNAFRLIQKEGSGWILVHHGLFELDDKYQSQGWGSAIYQRSEAFYLRNGVNRITLMADISVGGYAWARMGFDFATSGESKVFNGSFRRWLGQKNVVSSAIPSSSIDLTAWEISAFTYGGRRLGKDFLLGRSWDGVKYLDPDDPGFQVGQMYWEEKANK